MKKYTYFFQCRTASLLEKSHQVCLATSLIPKILHPMRCRILRAAPPVLPQILFYPNSSATSKANTSLARTAFECTALYSLPSPLHVSDRVTTYPIVCSFSQSYGGNVSRVLWYTRLPSICVITAAIFLEKLYATRMIYLLDMFHAMEKDILASRSAQSLASRETEKLFLPE